MWIFQNEHLEIIISHLGLTLELLICAERKNGSDLSVRITGSGNPEQHLKYVERCRAFKKLSEQKMHDNILVDDPNSDLITKRFGPMLSQRQIPIVFLRLWTLVNLIELNL